MILITGSNGFLGKRVCRLLELKKIPHLATSKLTGLDLCNRKSIVSFFENKKIEKIINCAAVVGGIEFGKKKPVDILHNNLIMTLNLFDAAKKNGINRIINPISNCVYPAKSTFFKEKEIWDGPMHESVMVYGFIRRASFVSSWAYRKQYGLDFINLIFPNMYGPEDHFDDERSHALGALIMKIVLAKRLNQKEVVIWGSGKPIREWIHVDDAAEFLIRSLYVKPYPEPINIGVGKGISIIEMAKLIKNIVGYEGNFVLDTTKTDGADHKTIDGSVGYKHFNWSPQIIFKKGLADTIQWYINNLSKKK